jgi:hypothetical protein
MEGYIKVYRKVMNNPIWQDPDLFRLWMYCLMKASHKERKVLVDKQEVSLIPGQFVTGRFSLHQEFNHGIPPRKQSKDTTLWSWLKKLEQMGNLDIKSYNKYSVVSIVNWNEYQATLTTESQQIDNELTSEQQQNDSKMTTESQQIDTNNNDKNVNNVKKGKNVKNVKKNKYADSVTLTPDEYQKLVDENGEYLTQRMIEVLDNYKGSSGKTYKSDYKAILSWVKDKVHKEALNSQKNNSSHNEVPRAFKSLQDWADEDESQGNY